MCPLFYNTPIFYFVMYFFAQNIYNANFLPIFLIFDHFDLIFGPLLFFLKFCHSWQFWLNFWASPTFFVNFFQLIITYHIFFILDYPHFIMVCVIFRVKMHIIPIFYQFLVILTNFGLKMGVCATKFKILQKNFLNLSRHIIWEWLNFSLLIFENTPLYSPPLVLCNFTRKITTHNFQKST